MQSWHCSRRSRCYSFSDGRPGFLVGEINIKGFSLGSGAVIFVGLAIGGIAPKAAPPALLGTLGLLLFLTVSVFSYGGQFFRD